MIRTMIALCLGAVALAQPSQSEAVPNASLLGSWQFSADTGDACTFSGNIAFSPHPKDDTFKCELTARQDCTDIVFTVRQSCTAFRSGDQLSIVSKIEEFLEGPETASYWPDNFRLSVVSGSYMNGALISHGTHPAEFLREESQLF